jgi:hypothetical protein
MKRLLFSICLLLRAPLFAGETDEDARLFNRGMESFNRSLYVEALADFMDLASRSPGSPLAEKSRALIWEIGDRIRRMEERWNIPGKSGPAAGGKTDEASAREFRKADALAALDRLVGRAGKDSEHLLRNLGGGALAAETGQPVDALQL